MSKVAYERAELLRYADLLNQYGDKVNSRRIYRFLLQQNANDREAIEGMQRLAGGEPTKPPLCSWLDSYITSGPPNTTLQEIERKLAEEDLPHQERGYLLVASGVLHFKGGNLLSARRSFEKALELDPTNYRSHCGLGIIHWRRGRYHDAWLEFMAALDLDITHLPALLGLLRVAQPLGRISLARCYLRRYLSDRPDHLDLWVLLAKVDLSVGRPEEAEKVLRRVLRQNSEHGEAKKLLLHLSTS
ncbi:MAG TPA: tetratricopeptide repeat protein [Bdellovibrionota bacterium]|nr:tetratricopeptide repeat protein [Bdellovibrionota bacterium]